jgi:exodeoxyribonuclease VII small subunit
MTMAKKKAGGLAKDQGPSFEDALARLETIVQELEEADLPLEKSLAVFEEGVRLSRLLHEKLNEAEKKVEILLKDEGGGKTAVAFKVGGEEDDAAVGAEDGEDEEDDGEDGSGEGGSGEGGSGEGGGPGQTGFRF